jgi:sigma-B regulation protein RsbU (phosphoserine phosphatase)
MLHKNNFQYFTMIYGILDVDNRNFRYCRAGHTPLLIQNPQGHIRVCAEGNVPVGLTEDCQYKELTVDFAAGDRLILYSDGITEARRQDSREFFGDASFFALLQKSRNLPVEKALPGVISEFKSWLGETRPPDDITIMIIEAD